MSRFIVDDFPAISFTRTEALSANGTEAGAAITLHGVEQGQGEVTRGQEQVAVGCGVCVNFLPICRCRLSYSTH